MITPIQYSSPKQKGSKMKKMSVLVVVLVLCLMASDVEQSFAQIDCLDGCTTGCVGSYINNPRLRSRCDRKCQIRCDSQVEESLH
ncbi:uncharacterized protein LOC126793397 [Argentina anserina]|uniref:uncharacterized protein LOC126793397 n=1 Tax=Argentina anserina TaxID=57926 RepID=UPI0021765BA1|nr:uncharacterized protein LOC126793397 [Potentilla anserina]